MGRIPKVMAIDAGGTMTDNFVIDDRGEFVVGKAQTTPEDESIGFINSFVDALHYRGMAPEGAFPTITDCHVVLGYIPLRSLNRSHTASYDLPFNEKRSGFWCQSPCPH